MKTVMDAVNEFKGVWNNDASNYLHLNSIEGRYLFSFKEYRAFNGPFTLVCSREQFDALVFDMTVNFGESSLKHLYIWQEGIKRQPETDEQHADKLNEMNKELGVMEIDWTKAPEGATHFYNNVGAFYNFSDKHNCLVFLKGGWEDCNNYSCFSGCLTPKPQPVFTQAMADNGETVKVGMNFKTGTNLIYTAKLVNSKSVCFEDEDGFLIGITINAPKPIDTRTDKEQAIDEIREEYLAYTGKEMGAFEFAYNKWVGE